MPGLRRHQSRVTESWNNFIALVSQASSGHEMAFRQALFTAVGQFFLVIVLLVGYQVYFILQTFLKPLAWAALLGTILFPFKTYLACGIREWIWNLKRTSTPLVVGTVLTPFKFVDWSFNLFGAEVWEFVWNHYMKILWAVVGVVMYFLGQVLVWNHMELVMRLSALFGNVLGFFSSKAIWFLIFPYFIAVNSLWTPQHRKTLRMLAWPLWIWLSLHLSSLLGSMAFPVFLIVGLVLLLGFYTEMKVVKGKFQKSKSMRSLYNSLDKESPDDPPEEPEKNANDSFWKVLTSSFYHLMNDSLMGDGHGEEEKAEDEVDREGASSPVPIPSALTAAAQLKLFAVNDGAAQGTRYMLYLFWSFIVVQALVHYYVIPFLLIPVVYRFVRVWGQQRGLWTGLEEYLVVLKNRAKFWVMMRKDVMAPAALRGLVRLAKQGDQMVLSVLEDCVDETVALILVLMGFVAAGICGIICMMEIQQETVYLVGLSGDFMNETLTKHPEILEWLPEGTQVQETVHTAMDSVYMYARDWMIGAMRDAIADTNLTRVALIEKDILSIADRVYQFYIPRDSAPVSHTFMRQTSMWGNRSVHHPLSPFLTETEDNRWTFTLWPQLNETWHKAADALDWSNISAYIKNNIETLTSVLESVWAVCKGNFSMLFSLVTTVLSIAVMYFSALMHFIFCIFVFIAALYYLLCSSKEQYRPLELISIISPHIAEAGHVAEIIEQTIMFLVQGVFYSFSDIFAVAFKMAAFYGFFTWVVLTIFGVYVKFIPSVVAAMLAVCPLVPPYVMCVPAACEMWFMRGEYVPAVLLMVVACSPSMFVDIAIYGDVKTSHPYMFGLSVAGGLVTMGLEGAVFGPVMLCILLVVVQVYRRILQPTTERSSIAVPSMMMVNPSHLPTLPSAMLPSPSTPDVTESKFPGSAPFLDRQESVTSYAGIMMAVAERELETVESSKSLEELPKEEALSSSKRRERLSSMGHKNSTPRESVTFAGPADFTTRFF